VRVRALLIFIASSLERKGRLRVSELAKRASGIVITFVRAKEGVYLRMPWMDG